MRGVKNIAIRDVHEFLDSKISSHPEINEWSPQTRLSLASHYLSAIGKQEGLTEIDFLECLFPLQNKSEMLGDLHFNMQTVGMTIQNLWTGIQDIEAIEDSVRLKIETFANKKKGMEKEKKKPGNGFICVRYQKCPE
jgi:hypothetical protein